MSIRKTNIRSRALADRHPGTVPSALQDALTQVYTETEVRELLDNNNRQTWWYRKQRIRDSCGFKVRKNWFYHKDLVDDFLVSIGA